MHCATVSKKCSELMSTALGITLLCSKAEQWEEEAKSAQSWWVVSCPLPVQQSTKYPSLQWRKWVMKQMQEQETKLEWASRPGDSALCKWNNALESDFHLSVPEISLDLNWRHIFPLQNKYTVNWARVYLLLPQCPSLFQICISTAASQIPGLLLLLQH